MKTRDEREQELKRLLESSDGQDFIIKTYREEVLPPGQMGPVGMLVSQMIPPILNHEYPTPEQA